MIEFPLALPVEIIATAHEGLELLKGGGLFGLIAYLLYSDRKDRTLDREADIKRSEAMKALADAVVLFKNKQG